MERLASFCAVADAGSIARVADKDPTRQSLISRQIRELETFFGVELVRRKGSGLELTEAGRELAAVGRENFKGLADFAARCAGAPWTVRMVASNSVAYWLVLPRLKRLEKDCPKIRFEIYHEQTREIVTTTREGTYDIAFVHEDALDSGLKKTVLGSVGHSVLVPKSLRRKAPTDLTGLVRVPMALPIGGRMRSLMDDLAAKAGITLQVAVGCSSYLQSAQLFEIRNVRHGPARSGSGLARGSPVSPIASSLSLPVVSRLERSRCRHAACAGEVDCPVRDGHGVRIMALHFTIKKEPTGFAEERGHRRGGCQSMPRLTCEKGVADIIWTRKILAFILGRWLAPHDPA